ncbi:DUF2460 domain-containing protein [Rhodopseudomonas palustris]|nr:DUF2460 domain-containing protein [Rhodopseudomonas palustris]
MDDVIFPVHISHGSAGGPDWPAEIVTLGSGAEQRNTSWSAPLRTYDAKYGVRKLDELYEILSLYHVAMGRLRGFRLMDWSDYRSCSPQQMPRAIDQALGGGDGTTTSFALSKRYRFAGHHFDRRITKPYGSILIAIDGTQIFSGFVVDLASGVVTFGSAPPAGAVLTWGGQFHVPVRFDSRLDQTQIRGPIGDIPSIPLKELRL